MRRKYVCQLPSWFPLARWTALRHKRLPVFQDVFTSTGLGAALTSVVGHLRR
jgi:hypothetical protein